MELYGIRIFVDDIAAAKAFYGGVLGLLADWEMEWAAGYRVGAAVLIVEREDPAGPDAALIGRFVGVSLAVADIDATWRDLSQKGVVFEGPPQRQDWGGALAHFRDPAGNVLTLLG